MNRRGACKGRHTYQHIISTPTIHYSPCNPFDFDWHCTLWTNIRYFCIMCRRWLCIQSTLSTSTFLLFILSMFYFISFVCMCFAHIHARLWIWHYHNHKHNLNHLKVWMDSSIEIHKLTALMFRGWLLKGDECPSASKQVCPSLL